MKNDKIFIWLIHCPRTGGTSIKDYCLDLDKKGMARFERTAHRRYSDAEKAKMIKKYGKIVSITTVRDPITHSESLFSYIRSDRSNKEFRLAKSGFVQWISKPSNHNYLMRFWGGSLDEAERNLKQIDHVLQMESLKRSFNRILASIGLPKSFNLFRHKGDVTKYTLNEKEKDLVRKFREKDYELLERLGFKY